MHPEEVEARSLLSAVAERFGHRAEQQERAITVDASEETVLRADPLRLRQALGNLIDNALRHGEGEITLSARSSDGGVELAVVDEGPGFPPELAERAFDRFARGDAARTRGGAGLGLAIVETIARAHGGEAGLAAGERSVVQIRLPNA